MKFITAPFSILWRHRQLIWALAQREMLAPTAGQAFGVVWAVLPSIFWVVLLVVVFNNFLRVTVTGVPGPGFPFDYTTYMLAGMVPWQSFSILLGRSSNEIVSNTNLVKQVVFPLEVLPARGVVASLPFLVLGGAGLVLYVLFTQPFMPWTYVLLPVIIFLQLLWMLGCAFFLSGLGTYLRDLKDVVGLLLVGALYFLPAIYLPQYVPEPLRVIIQFNPFSNLVWCYQDALYFGKFNHPWAWGLTVLYSFLAFYVGFYLFRYLKPYFGSVL